MTRKVPTVCFCCMHLLRVMTKPLNFFKLIYLDILISSSIKSQFFFIINILCTVNCHRRYIFFINSYSIQIIINGIKDCIFFGTTNFLLFMFLIFLSILLRQIETTSEYFDTMLRTISSGAV